MRYSKILYVIIPLLSGVISAVAVYFFIQNYLYYRAEQDAKNLLLDNRGFHQYIQKVIHPSIFEAVDSGLISKEYYDPQVMSSTYIIRTLHKYTNDERVKLGLQPLYYKLAALHPRNPVNKADDWEAKNIDLFRNDSNIHEKHEVVIVNKKKFLYYAIPFLRNENRCLRCHGNPADAPPGLRRLYPLGGGFFEKAGELRAIESIRVPLDSEGHFAAVLAGFCGVGLFVIFILFLFNKGLKARVDLKTRSLEKEIEIRKQTMNDLIDSEEKFKNAFDNSSIGKTLTYLDDSISTNVAFCQMLGYTKEEMAKKKWQEITFSEDVPVFHQCLDDLLSGTKKTVRVNMRYVKKNGEIVWADVNAILQKDHRDNPAYFITGVIDITDRKIATEALSAEKERLLVTLRSIGDAVIATDVKGEIVLMNRVAEHLTGWSLHEASGKPLTDVFKIINELTRQPVGNPADKVLLSGEIIELANHTLLISRDGTERIIADSGAPIKDHDSKTIGVVLVFRDMTEKQKLIDVTQNIQKLESIGVLAGGIAHDFNNLLGGIYGYIDLSIDEDDTDRIQQNLKKAIVTIDRARALTSQLLTFSKGGAPIQKNGNLFPFIQDTAQFALSGSNVSCTFTIQGDLWSCKFDKNQIGQVIDNLIINAQQAMPSGGSIELYAKNITISEQNTLALQQGNYVHISIKDHGTGISKDVQTRIFDPFFTTKAKGHGLGLATSYSIINKHGGCIQVESEPGVGSIFHLYLPASNGPVLAESGAYVDSHKGLGTFLVMDDEVVMRETIKGMLEDFGYSVICKENGEDAVNCYLEENEKNKSFKGMIFDLTVPGAMGGIETASRIRKLHEGNKVLIFVASGYGEDPVMKDPAAYGFNASISKPFRKSELEELLNKYVV